MDVSLLYFIFAIYTKRILSEEGVCKQPSGKLTCCTGYRKVDDKCLLCPKDLYGEESNEICPEGRYGEACEEECQCKNDQICDVEHGCVYNVTELSEDITTHGDLQKGGLSLQYFYITPIVIIWLLCIVALSLRWRKRLYRPTDVNNDAGNTVTHNVQLEEVAIFGPSNQSLSGPVSDYAEIRDSSTAYPASYETSSIYNELSFSKLKALKKISNPVNSLYDTTAACVVNTEAMFHIDNPVNSCYDAAQGCVVDAKVIWGNEIPVNSCYDTAQGRVVDAEGNENPVKSCYETTQAFGVVAEAAVDIGTPVNSCHETDQASTVNTEAQRTLGFT